MLRRASVLLILVAGCDQVLGLERAGHDEDKDGTPDDSDLCPHLAENQVDSDSDGIGDQCDPGPGDDTRYFFPFHDGTEGLSVNGSNVVEGDDLVFGAPSESTVTMYLLASDGTVANVGDAWIDLGFTLLEPEPDGGFHETGVVFVNQPMDSTRGEICFAGYDGGMGTEEVSSYLELVEDEERKNVVTASTSLLANEGRLVAKRSTTEVTCSVTANGVALTDGYTPDLDRTGRIGIFQQRTRARLRYLWIATRPSRP